MHRSTALATDLFASLVLRRPASVIRKEQTDAFMNNIRELRAVIETVKPDLLGASPEPSADLSHATDRRLSCRWRFDEYFMTFRHDGVVL
jgi:hypothetical protein